MSRRGWYCSAKGRKQHRSNLSLWSSASRSVSNSPVSWRTRSTTWQNADVFVLSSWYEGFGNVLIEAMATGCPVVSTDCPSGPHEILEGGTYGPLVPVQDPVRMAEAIDTTLADQPERMFLTARADEFSIPRITEQYTEIFFDRENDYN